MKTKKWTTLVASSLAACALSALSYGQTKPEALKGIITAKSTSLKLGDQAELSWSFSYPAVVKDVATIPSATVGNNNGVITATNQDLNISMKMLGQGVTSGSTYIRTKGYINYNNGGDRQIFDGTNVNIAQSQLINLSSFIPNNIIKVGKGIAFSGQYQWNGQWTNKRISNASNENPRSVRFLYNGQTPPSNVPAHNAPSLESFLKPYLDATGKVKIGPLDVIIFMELTHSASQTSDPGYDLQDLVMLVSLTPTNYTTLTSNSGSGSVSPTYTTRIEQTAPGGIVTNYIVTESTPLNLLIGNGQLDIRKPFSALTSVGNYVYKLISTSSTGQLYTLDTTTVTVSDPVPPPVVPPVVPVPLPANPLAKVEITIDSKDGFGRKQDLAAIPGTDLFKNRSYENPGFAENPEVPGLSTSYKPGIMVPALPINQPPDIRRTRVDQPFKVYITTTCGAVNAFTTNDPDAPLPTDARPLLPDVDKSVVIKMSKQAYPTGANFDDSLLPENSAIVSEKFLNTTNLSFRESEASTPKPLKHKPLTKLPDEYYPNGILFNITTPTEVYITATRPNLPTSVLASERIKIWPLSAGQISGVPLNQSIRFTIPKLTFSVTNLYPDATAFAVCYAGVSKGPSVFTDSTLLRFNKISGSPTQVNPISDNKSGDAATLESIIITDGKWTVDWIEYSPSFGSRLLDSKTFDFDRSINVNASITTSN
jgi:hypothetical protein